MKFVAQEFVAHGATDLPLDQSSCTEAQTRTNTLARPTMAALAVPIAACGVTMWAVKKMRNRAPKEVALPESPVSGCSSASELRGAMDEAVDDMSDKLEQVHSELENSVGEEADTVAEQGGSLSASPVARFAVRVGSVVDDENRPCVVGSHASLGDWDLSHAIEMERDEADPCVWHATISWQAAAGESVHYKFVTIGGNWECGDNRELTWDGSAADLSVCDTYRGA